MRQLRALSLLCLGGGAAQAASDGTGLAVSALLVPNCSVAGSALNMGAYDPVVVNKAGGSNREAQGFLLDIICTNDLPAQVTLGHGASPDAGSTDDEPLRRMQGPSNARLPYKLYLDAVHGRPWGNSARRGRDYRGAGVWEQLQVYAVVSPGHNVPAGDYTDVLVASVSF